MFSAHFLPAAEGDASEPARAQRDGDLKIIAPFRKIALSLLHCFARITGRRRIDASAALRYDSLAVDRSEEESGRAVPGRRTPLKKGAVSMRPLCLVLIALVVLPSCADTTVATPAAATVTLGEADKVGDALVLRESTVIRLTKAQASPSELARLSAERGPLVYYDDTLDGVIGVIGAPRIAFADAGKGLTEILAMSDAAIEKLFGGSAPMPYEEFTRRYAKPEGHSWPTVPVRMDPGGAFTFLSTRTSNFLLVDSGHGIYVLRVVEIRKAPQAIVLEVHRK